ncbi:MAG: hypothetical protein J2P21_27405, partial [Chloracidobacterium sp.]|nr:hypothetical protein [Chloracidobacterium sp.]
SLMPSMTPESHPLKPESAPTLRISWPSLLTGVLIGLLLAVTVWTARGLLSPAKSTGTPSVPRDSPDLAELWEPFLQNNRPLVILFSSLPFYRYDSGFIRDFEMNNPARRETRVRELQSALKSSPLIPWNNFTTYGEANGIFLLTRFLSQRSRELLLRRSSTFNWEEIGDYDVIIVGSLSSDPRLREIPVKWAFEVRENEIINLNPLEGEPERYVSKISLEPGPLPQDGYTLISISPGLRGNGRFLIITAVNDPGRWAGAQYLTDEHHVRELAAKLRGGANAIPQFVQIIIRSRFQSMVPVEISYVTHRRL